MLFSVQSILVASTTASCFLSAVSAAPNWGFTSKSTKNNKASSNSVVNQTTCNGETYVYQELAGYGYIASNARDKYGDTIGGIGSSIAIDKKSWKKKGKSYTGILWALPDRGWNTEGTLNFQNRVHKVAITLTPNSSATVSNPSGPNLQLKYLDTVLFTDPHGVPMSGLDASPNGPYLTYPGYKTDVPSTNFTGNGFGGSGPGGRRAVLDSEGLVLNSDGSFWVSDEYGPYVYHFSASGRMTAAIRPPDAFIPLRNGSESFSADSPPLYDLNETVIPEDNPTGRDNNQGFEGLTISPDGKTLSVLIQSALNQEGGLKSKTRKYARLVQYSLTHGTPQYFREYVVPLPQYPTSTKIAAQSEIHALSNTQFLILARDSNSGRGQDSTESVYRHADIFDISNATDVKGAANDCYNCSIASVAGVLNDGITTAEYCSFLDFNVNSQLERFGVHNGGAQDSGLLNEKWESLALVPVDGNGADGEYFLFSLSDNDFITQDGYLNFGRFQYKDSSGYDLLNQALVFKVKLPKGVTPS